MCQVNVLAEERYGYVSICEECHVLNLTFGNFSMQLNEDDYRMYIDFLKNYAKKYQSTKNEYFRNITIYTLVDNLQLVLSYRELIDLRNLMLSALFVLDTERMVQV